MAVDYFLKLATIDGESESDKHTKEIKVESFSWGGSQTSTVHGTGGSGAGKVDLSDLSMQISFDKSTTKLFAGLCHGTHFATAVLSGVKAGSGGGNFFSLDLTEVFLTSLQFSGSSEVPSVSLSVTYKSATMKYFTQDAKGVLTNAGTEGWDITTNKKV